MQVLRRDRKELQSLPSQTASMHSYVLHFHIFSLVALRRTSKALDADAVAVSSKCLDLVSGADAIIVLLNAVSLMCQEESFAVPTSQPRLYLCIRVYGAFMRCSLVALRSARKFPDADSVAVSSKCFDKGPDEVVTDVLLNEFYSGVT